MISEQVTFTFEGRRVTGLAGQSIGAALHAAGVHVLSTSAKYRRPRGLYCVAGACPSCSLRVNGLPGVTACTTPLRGGEHVERDRHGFVSDVALDRLSRLAPAGFHYERLARSPRLWRRAERVLARLAGAARLPDRDIADDFAGGGFELRRIDVAVVGGGQAGLRAAAGAAREGSSVLLAERDHELGGWLLSEPGGRARAAALAEDARAAGVELRVESTAIGWYDEGLLGVATPAGLLALEPRKVVLATGTYERGLPFEDGDRPGVLLAAGAQRLLVRDGVLCGRSVLVATDEEYGERIAGLLRDAGARAELLDLHGGKLLRAHGRRRVESATVQVQGRSRRVPCDAICLALGRRPADELALQIPPERRA